MSSSPPSTSTLARSCSNTIVDAASRSASLQEARSRLHDLDPVMARLIDARPDFDPHAWLAELPPMNLYGTLLFQIVGQQLSVAATRRTLERIEALFGGHLPSPAELLAVDPNRLREAGLSWRKTGTLRDLAERLSDGPAGCGCIEQSPERRVHRGTHHHFRHRPLDSAGRTAHRSPARGRGVAGRPGVAEGRPARVCARPFAEPTRGPRHRRKMAALPQSRHRLPVLGGLRRGQSTTSLSADTQDTRRLCISLICISLIRPVSVTGAPGTGGGTKPPWRLLQLQMRHV